MSAKQSSASGIDESDARLYLHLAEIRDADGAIPTCCHQAIVLFLHIKKKDHLT